MNPSDRPAPVDHQRRRVVCMACSLLLDYPGERLGDQIAAVRAALGELPDELAAPIERFCTAAERRGLRSLQEHYVATFDQRRRCALYLTYYTHGDTRGRGQAILAFREVLARAGFEETRGELPDYLPIVLELCARDESGTGTDLLAANREGIEVIRRGLHEAGSPYAQLLDALAASLGEPSAAVLAACRALVSQGPPAELVGIGDLTATPYPMRER